ncbi:iron-containing redox enzyme family protein [Verticiella alkaliphila]|uniref:iron-containing redox enzyme family protein n=1 Tax=Verticiella alkaliphila TaxID=2779529 RepID=UPI003530557E
MNPDVYLQPPRVAQAPGEAQTLYDTLLRPQPAPAAIAQAHAWLDDRLAEADLLDCDLPSDPADLPAWLARRNAAVGEQYTAYLAERQAGGPRRYFSNRAHALFFLRGVAPTKRVDGAWLYGLSRHWQDVRYAGLITTYLEELGEGDARANHVAMYERLLAEHGCDAIEGLTDEQYVQGAIQLALAHGADCYLPEVIGFNLGYEQLPLHLLITAYEFNELGLDPYYFTVHVTGDNAHSGHARKAMDSVRQLWPVLEDGDTFAQRLRRGYLLNDLGAGTLDVIHSFDLETELCRILADKSAWGRHAHSDYCRIEGRTVNDWLQDPTQARGLLQALEKSGWLRRGAPPEESRFWKLLQSERGEMFGVFSGYEQQVLADWIADGRVPEGKGQRRLTFRASRRLRDTLLPSASALGESPANDDIVDGDIALLRARLEKAKSRADVMAELVPLIGPATHATPVGLLATRQFNRLHRTA